MITNSCGGVKRDDRQGTFCGQRQCSRDVPFQEPLQDGGSRLVKIGLNWDDVHIEYKESHTALTEAVVGFAHLYAYGLSKCTFLAGLTGRPIHNLVDLECPPPVSFNHKRWCTLPGHKFPTFSCATKTSHSLYD